MSLCRLRVSPAFAVLLCLDALVSGAVAQDFKVPSTWRRPSTSLSVSDRQDLANSAADILVSRINFSKGTVDGLDSPRSAALVSVLAVQDWVVGGTPRRADVVRNSLDIYASKHPDYDKSAFKYGIAHTDTLGWGLAAVYAYRAYNDRAFLDIATDNWRMASQDAVAADGRIPRDSTFETSCASELPGALFVIHTGLDSMISTQSVNMYIALSAYLYEATKNQQYLDTAKLSASFVQRKLYADGQVAEFMSGTSCGVGKTQYTWNAGTFIEGLSVLANVTGDSSWTKLLGEVVVGAATDGAWNAADGRVSEVIRDDGWGNTQKRQLIRGLAEAFYRNPGTDMAAYIKAYLLVQFNAVLDSATVTGSNVYTANWLGPPPTTFSPEGSIAALEVINTAYSLDKVVPKDSPPPGPETAAPPPEQKKKPIGAIIGGVIGGVAVLLGVFFGLVFFYRARRRRYDAGGQWEPKAADLMAGEGHASVVQPFLAHRESPSPTPPPPAPAPVPSPRVEPSPVVAASSSASSVPPLGPLAPMRRAPKGAMASVPIVARNEGVHDDPPPSYRA